MDTEPVENDEKHGPTRRTLLQTAVWTAPVVAASVPAPAFAASPATLTFRLSQIGFDAVRVSVTGGRNGLTISISNLGVLGYAGIEGVTRTFSGGTATFDQTGGSGVFISGWSYSLTFSYDGGSSTTIAVAGGASKTVSV